MKKTYTFLLAIAISTCSISQTFLTEDFSDRTMPPTGWSIENFTDLWTNTMDNKAGGSAPEARFNRAQLTGLTRFISPQINLSGYESVALRFNQFLDDHNGVEYTIGVATRSGGGDWNTTWEVSPTGNIGPEDLFITIDNDDVGTNDFQFCFFVDGNFVKIDHWSIDDVSLFNPYDLDCQMNSIITYPFVLEPAVVEGVVCNTGLSPITSIEVSWQVEDGTVHTSNYSGFSIDLGEKYEFECPDLFNYPIGTYDLNVWLSGVNGTTDDNTENDLLTKNMSVVSNIVFKRPLMEQFASSNSSICAWVNAYFVPWCDDHADSITLFKYPWRYPYPTDPYYIEECRARETYYEIGNWIDVFLFGNGINTDISNIYYINEFFDEAIQEPGFASIVASRSTVNRGTVMDIDVTILPYANFNNHRLFVAVFEKTTTGNVGDNGETEFKHIMMKMVPDPYGTEIFLNDRESTTISQSIDLAGTFVEEWDDLGVAIFIQNVDTREVFQSTYAIENANFASDATLSELNVDGTLIVGFNPDVYEYNVELPMGTTVVPEVTGVPNDENAIVVVVPANELPGTTTIEVFAEDLVTKLTYSVNFTVITGFEDPAAANVKVYPNPTKGIVKVAGVNNASIEVYSISGKLISKVNNSNGQTIDLSSQTNGVYIIKIFENDFVLTKRVILNR